jgi:predicted amidohydrolase
LAIIDRAGKLHCNYRKTHLYFNDKLWAKEGSGFMVFEIKNLKGEMFKCVPAICMDINPKDFTSGEYELADFIVKNKAEIMLLFTNWVDSSTDNVEASHIKATYNYWLSRMMPLIQ